MENKNRKKILLLGLQGSGKGTQGEQLSQKLSLPQISTGDIMRREIKSGSEFGRLIDSYITAGNLLPDDLTNKIVAARLKEDDCQNGFILDGYPRNLSQAEFLDRTDAPNIVILIKISDQEAIKRLASRLSCRCGMSYRPEYKSPKKEGICDRCGKQLYKRDDDSDQEAIKVRMDTYHRETEPLINYYKNKEVLIEINGEQSISKVQGDILEKISEI